MEYRVIELLQELKSIMMGQPKQDKWMGISEASKYCSCSIQTLRRAVKLNKLDASKTSGNGKYLFKKSSLESWITD